MLRAVGLAKSYRAPSGVRLPILGGVDLSVKPGELVAVSGRSGSGKSTLLNCLGLLEQPDAGDIWYGTERVTALSRRRQSRARGRSIGFIFQSFLLIPSLTALDNVALAARYAGFAGGGQSARVRAMELLAEVGVGDRAEHYPAELSGGEQQRVAFCRAMLNDPPVVLADEPTGNLDDANASVILERLSARARAGAAVVVVTHRADVTEIASRVLTLSDGHLTPHTRSTRRDREC